MNKYIFTKYGYHKNDLKLNDIVSDMDEDYDVSDIFLIDFYNDEGETISVEAEDLEEAVYAANRWFGTCVTAENIRTADDWCRWDWKSIYIPAPVKIMWKNDWRWTKRSKKYYGKKKRKCCYSPYSVCFDYDNFRKHSRSF